MKITKTLKKYLYITSSLLTMAISGEAVAQINFKSFNNITYYFKPEKQYFSPIFGKTAIESGLIHNLRFYGNITSKIDEANNRNYKDDEGQDALSKLVKELFPSPAGQLTTQSGGDRNFGKYVKSPKIVAHIINFSEKARQLTEKKQSLIVELSSSKSKKAINLEINANGLNKILDETVSLIKNEVLKVHSLNDFKKVNKTLNNILNYISDSIIDENSGKYPKYTTEQIISAFFCEHFDHQKDIIVLLNTLDENLVYKNQLPSDNDLEYLTQKHAQSLLVKNDINVDDLFTLLNFAASNEIIPYKDGTLPISNGNTYKYNRELNTILKNESTFSDCAEVSARHVMNLILYDGNKNKFDLSYISNENQKVFSPYFKNFEDFYEIFQTPFLANAGNIDIRSQWNRVVSDLNDNQNTNQIIYNKNTNELEPGFINFLTVFGKIFNIEYAKFDDDVSIYEDEKWKARKDWLNESFQTLFGTLNPKKNYKLDLNFLKNNDSEISGILPITVKDKETSKNLFSFDFIVDFKKHSEIKNIKILQPSNSERYYDKALTFSTVLKDTQESIWLLSPNFYSFGRLKHSLYTLFYRQLLDNDSRIDFLTTLCNNNNITPYYMDSISYISHVIKNILIDMSWDDNVVVDKISPIVLNFLKIHGLSSEIKKSFITGTKALNISGYDISFFKEFNNLTTLKFLNTNEHNFNLINYTELKALDLGDNKGTKRVILENIPKLERVVLPQNVSEEIVLKNLSNLKNLNVKDRITKRVWVENLPMIESFSIFDIQCEEVIMKDMATLKELKLGNARANHVLIDNLPLFSDIKLDRFLIPKLTFNNLPLFVTLNLHDIEAIKNIALKDLPNLENILLKSNRNLTTLELPSKGKHSIKKIELEDLPSLIISQNAFDTVNETLQEIKITNVQNIDNINLNKSSVEKVTLRNLSNLKSLTLNTTKNLNKIEVAALPIFETLSLDDSSIKEIKGLENLPYFRYLTINYLPNLHELTLKNMPNLLEVILFNLTLTSINFDDLPSLKAILSVGSKSEEVSVRNMKNLKEIFFDEESSFKNIYCQDLSSLESIQLAEPCDDSLPHPTRIIFKGNVGNSKNHSNLLKGLDSNILEIERE